jgi:hypothetical protein
VHTPTDKLINYARPGTTLFFTIPPATLSANFCPKVDASFMCIVPGFDFVFHRCALCAVQQEYWSNERALA